MLIAKVSFEPDTATTALRGAYALAVVPKAVGDVDVRGLPAPLAASPTPAPTPSPAAASPAPSAAPAATGQATVQIIAQGTASGVRQPVNVIIRTAEEWQAVWGTHAQGAQAQAQPNVDMTKQSVIGIFLGEQQGIGGIAIDAMQMTQAGTIQLAAHVVPAAAAQGTAKVTPFMLISMPKTAAPVEIQIQGAPQAPTLGNPQAAGAQPASASQTPTGYGQPATGTARPGFGQPTTGATQPGFGQAVGGSQLGGMPGGVSLGGANAAPPFPGRGSLITGGGGGGLLGPGGYY
jgi:hypothetical protein